MQKIASLLLRNNGIKFDKEELSFQIQSHPSYPSLYAITGVLNHFNINNIAARVPNTKESLELLPKSFIGQFKNEKNQGLFLVEKYNNSYRLTNSEGSTKTITCRDFIKVFTGVILAVEKQENNKKIIPSKNLYTTIGFIIAMISFLMVVSISSTNVLDKTVLLASMIGVLISILILQQEFGIKNIIGDAFCPSGSGKKDCNTVLTSNGARLFKLYALSDLSIIYFSGFTIGAFLFIINGQSLQLLYFTSLLVLPVTLYSIYYQAFTVKVRCILCISIVAVLWIQAGISLFLRPFSSNVDFELIDFLIILMSFFGSFSIWSLVKPKYIEAIENKSYKLESFKFRRNYNLFYTLLKSKPKVNTVLQTKEEIVFGNVESKLEIVIITNPFCRHCKPVHTMVEEILKKHDEDVKIIIRFNIDLSNADSDVFKITATIFHLHITKGKENSMAALHEVYNDLSPKDWIVKWSDQTVDLKIYKELLSGQIEWCLENQLNFTPTILINGYRYPKEYEKNDLGFFMPELHEEYNE